MLYSQQILSRKLLLVVTNGQKHNLRCEFKLESLIIYHLRFIVKVL